MCFRCSASTQHGPTDLILFLKGRQPDTGELLTEIYLPDVRCCTRASCPHRSAEKPPGPARSAMASPLISQSHCPSRWDVFVERLQSRLQRETESQSAGSMHQHLVEKSCQLRFHKGGINM